MMRVLNLKTCNHLSLIPTVKTLPGFTNFQDSTIYWMYPPKSNPVSQLTTGIKKCLQVIIPVNISTEDPAFRINEIRFITSPAGLDSVVNQMFNKIGESKQVRVRLARMDFSRHFKICKSGKRHFQRTTNVILEVM
jgi:hypothetical protein